MNKDRKLISKAKLLVVKLGTGVLSSTKGGLDSYRIAHLADQVAHLHRLKKQVVIVSSGAVWAGMARLNLRNRPTHVADFQACAAVGQNLLMAKYERAFARRKLTVAQILLTHEDFRHPQRRHHARQTILNLLLRGVVPIINENDAVSFDEIKLGDNDQLAAMVHELINAQGCIILSNVDGFIAGDISSVMSAVRKLSATRGSSIKHRMPRPLSTITKITAEIERQAGDSHHSHRSVGGMRSKLLAAKRVLATGHPLVIANGHTPNILLRLIRGELLGTIFLKKR